VTEEPGSSELLSQLTGSLPTGSSLVVVLDALPDAILVVDAEGTIRHATQRIEALSGHGPDELVGRNVDELVPHDRREHHGGLRETYVQDPAPRSMGSGLGIELRHRSGRLVPVDISLSPVTVGDTRFVVAAVRDAGPRRQTEQALRDALEREHRVTAELRGLDELKTSFLRAISHDLRSPLATMLGLAMTIVDHMDQLDPGAVRDLLRRLVSNGHRLERLLTDLLDLDRLTRGVVEPERHDVDLIALTTRVIEQMELPEGAVDLHAPQELLWPVDGSQVERIVENLIGNARKHAPTDRPVTVRIRANREVVTISVEDRGPGVPDADKERIFQPFARGQNATSAGTGVGLSLVAQFAAVHGGRAWVEDRAGGGATFNVTLPRET